MNNLPQAEPAPPNETPPTGDDEAGGVSALPIVIAIVVLVVFSVIFLLEFLDLSQGTGGLTEEQITADSYMDVVEPLLVGADPEEGALHMVTYGCTTCHGNNLAPDFETTIANAAQRRPPMRAEAYIYEAIIHPGAHVVEPYQNNMPRVYDDTVSDDDLGDMIAYLAGLPADTSAAAPDAGADTEVTADAAVPTPGGPVELTEEMITEYEIQANFLLTGADPVRGAELVAEYSCNSCHAGEAAG
ncbi:MAG: c-type cytochrome, partial [Chloroflexota bacterium]